VFCFVPHRRHITIYLCHRLTVMQSEWSTTWIQVKIKFICINVLWSTVYFILITWKTLHTCKWLKSMLEMISQQNCNVHICHSCSKSLRNLYQLQDLWNQHTKYNGIHILKTLWIRKIVYFTQSQTLIYTVIALKGNQNQNTSSEFTYTFRFRGKSWTLFAW
jgi:hypothetical protein